MWEAREGVGCEKGHKALNYIISLNPLPQVSAKIIIQGGHPGEHICKVAKKESAALIVCGSRGMGTVRRTILGSTSDYIIHHAHCPVVVVPKEKHSKKHGHEGETA